MNYFHHVLSARLFITVFTLITTLFFMLLMEISWKLGVFYMESAIGETLIEFKVYITKNVKWSLL